MKPFVTLALCLTAAGGLSAQSTINSTQKLAWAANTGWLNLRSSPEDGVVVGSYVFSGYVYGANTGWLHLGTGTPQDHVRYGNTDSADFGVNVMSGGLLRGLAYGANIGWVSFETVGDPRLNLATGAMSGYAYGANIGWINLGDLSFQLITDTIQPGADTDQDQLADAWEYQRAGGLTLLANPGDADGDGVSDLNEYLADTQPLAAIDAFTVGQTQFTKTQTGDVQFTLTWRSSPDRLYAIEYRDDLAPGPWTDSGLGIFAGGTGTNTTRTVTGPPTARRFYRTRVQLPLHP